MIYAVNKETKEHRDVSFSEGIKLEMKNWVIVDADDEGWIPWHGGECPLPDNAVFHAKTKNSGTYEECSGWRWTHKNLASDIIAYRPILNDKPQATEWNGEGLPPVGTVCEYQNNSHCSWKRVEVTAIGRDKMLLWDLTLESESSLLIKAAGNFRPIFTDRERWIAAAMNAVVDKPNQNTYEAIYDAGLGKLSE